jgi:hypothetical protein
VQDRAHDEGSVASKPDGDGAQTEARFRQQEIELKEREQKTREEELRIRQQEINRSYLSNPLFLALVAATVAAFGNIIVAAWNNRATQDVERQKANDTLRLEERKAEAARILEVIKTNDPDKAAVNLSFLLDAHLIASPDQRRDLEAYLKNRQPGKGVALPSPVQALPNDIIIFDNGNVDAVENGPTDDTVFTVFTVATNYFISYIWTYHWNDARGKVGGNIRLHSEKGEEFGPWAVQTSPGQGGVLADWECFPNVIIPAGTYKVIDSDPATWSRNAKSGGRGITRIKGHPAT